MTGTSQKAIFLSAAIFMLAALLVGCGSSSVGIIGGADGPTKIVVTDQNEAKSPPESETPAAITATDGAVASDAVDPPVPQSNNAENVSASDSKSGPACTLSISCATVLDNADKLDPAKVEIIPEDGILLAAETVSFEEGNSVFDLLVREAKSRKLHMESVEVPVYKSCYIEGIGNLYEFDCGEVSGWMYKVNGVFPNYGASKYPLKDGDVVEWIYSCDLGRDIGAYNVNQKQ